MRTKISVSGFFTMLFLMVSSAAVAHTPVSPSSDLTGVTDQVNIQAALEAEKNGGTVELAAGTFYVHKSIVVFGFDGIFKGVDKSLTSVRTAPGVNFDVSASLDAIPPLFPPARGFIASMFLFPYTPSDEPKSFTMSDMTIVVDEAAVDPPLDGYIDDRRAYLLNTMHAVIVINTDIVPAVLGLPYDTVNLTSTIQRMEIKGIQDPRFRGFWDESEFDTDNSIFDGVYLGGPSIAPAAVVEAEVINADIAFNLSDHTEALIENSLVKHAVLGIENWFNPTIAQYNEILETYIPIDLIYDHDSIVESNFLSGDGWSPMLINGSPSVEVSGNTVTGSWVYGINPFFGSNDCVISDNLLFDMSSLFGSVSIELTDGCVITNNTFANVDSPFGFGAVWVWGKGNEIKNNDYSQSGLPGWSNGNGAVLLDFDSFGNKVSESLFPINTTMCDQVIDLSAPDTTSQGRNSIPGYGVCNNNPEIAEHLQEVFQQHQGPDLEFLGSGR